mmetsp:Transcript_11262/g.16448  ORF Transcript_11262/g.16448 Transcript_11262/m.16448 type:complete len:232 (-) Transcript_11262:265-960(-)
MPKPKQKRPRIQTNPRPRKSMKPPRQRMTRTKTSPPRPVTGPTRRAQFKRRLRPAMMKSTTRSTATTTSSATKALLPTRPRYAWQPSVAPQTSPWMKTKTRPSPPSVSARGPHPSPLSQTKVEPTMPRHRKPSKLSTRQLVMSVKLWRAHPVLQLTRPEKTHWSPPPPNQKTTIARWKKHLKRPFSRPKPTSRQIPKRPSLELTRENPKRHFSKRMVMTTVTISRKRTQRA